jgi:hypothetical protein
MREPSPEPPLSTIRDYAAQSHRCGEVHLNVYPTHSTYGAAIWPQAQGTLRHRNQAHGRSCASTGTSATVRRCVPSLLMLCLLRTGRHCRSLHLLRRVPQSDRRFLSRIAVRKSELPLCRNAAEPQIHDCGGEDVVTWSQE